MVACMSRGIHPPAFKVRLGDDGLLQDGAPEQLAVGEIIQPCRHLPGISQKGPADHFPPTLRNICV
jgi:hypothetical protein